MPNFIQSSNMIPNQCSEAHGRRRSSDTIRCIKNMPSRAFSLKYYRNPFAIVCVRIEAATSRRHYVIWLLITLSSGLSKEKRLTVWLVAPVTDKEAVKTDVEAKQVNRQQCNQLTELNSELWKLVASKCVLSSPWRANRAVEHSLTHKIDAKKYSSVASTERALLPYLFKY